MVCFLFDKIVFGPVQSRRMGLSLGINLLPVDRKLCSYNCIYCECGWTNISTEQSVTDQTLVPDIEAVSQALEERLKEIASSSGQNPDTITFAGNGEPTLHIDFPAIIEETIRLRDKYIPSAEICVLSNGTALHNDSVFEALKKVDMNIQKLDAGTQEMIKQINQPCFKFDIDSHVKNLCKFEGDVIIQTLFLRAEFEGKLIDNTVGVELESWLGHLKRIKPQYVMIYPVARATPVAGINKISSETLHHIEGLVNKIGIKTRVYN